MVPWEGKRSNMSLFIPVAYFGLLDAGSHRNGLPDFQLGVGMHCKHRELILFTSYWCKNSLCQSHLSSLTTSFILGLRPFWLSRYPSSSSSAGPCDSKLVDVHSFVSLTYCSPILYQIYLTCSLWCWTYWYLLRLVIMLFFHANWLSLVLYFAVTIAINLTFPVAGKQLPC